jgi:flagellar motor component MotA
MRKSWELGTRLAGLVFLAVILKLAFSQGPNTLKGAFDSRAFLLVFVAPWVLLMATRKAGVSAFSSLGRLSELGASPSHKVSGELADLVPELRGNFRASRLVKLSEGHEDAFVRYASGLLLAKYPADELNRLLSRRIEAEDGRWQELCNLFGFLAKMSPYFGMTATVIGMVKLLENMSDFTRISGGIALAMQGTLYGLLAFTLVYAPLQRLLQEARDQALQRNELIARFFLGVAQEADPSWLRDELQAQHAAQAASAAPRAFVAEQGRA